MNDNGWIKLHRSILKWEWWDEPNTMRLFIYCLLVANHDEQKWRGTTIPRGAFGTTIRRLAMEAGLTVQQTRTALSNLQSTHEITQQSTHDCTIIIVNNYDNYQCSDDEEQHTEQHNNQHTNNTQSTHEITHNQHTEQEINNNIILDSSLRSESMSDLPSDASSSDPKVEDEIEKIDYQKLIAFWNENSKGRWGTLRNIENNRRKMVKARIRTYGKDVFAEAILKACASDFLARQQWFSFDWLICPNNFDKVISGNYDNKSIPNNGTVTVNTATNGTGAVTRPQNTGLSTDF
jgi:hypothetical protein